MHTKFIKGNIVIQNCIMLQILFHVTELKTLLTPKMTSQIKYVSNIMTSSGCNILYRRVASIETRVMR